MPQTLRTARAGGLLPLAALLCLALLVSGTAQAAVYTNGDGHYHFTVPAGWDQGSPTSGTDVQYDNGVVFFGGATFAARHDANASAASTEAFLLAATQQAHDELSTAVHGTDVQGPRTFTTGGGRLAGEFVLDYSVYAVLTRVRQVFFASAGFGFLYTIAMTATPDDFENNSANWTTFVDSWGLDNEPSAPAGGSGPLPGFELWAAVGAVCGVALTVAPLRRRA